MVNKVISINGYETKIRDVRSNLSLLLNSIDQSFLRKITVPQVFQSILLKVIYLFVVIALLGIILVVPERKDLFKL
jgi:hypothetical protein